MNHRILVAAVAAVISTSALAQTPPLYTWTGFSVGGQGGFGWADGAVDDLPGPGTTFSESPEWNMDGAFLGGYVGANLQWNQFVIGLEGDANWSDVDGGELIVSDDAFLSGDIEWFGSARGRIGVAWDRVLLFGTGGAAFAEAEHTQDTTGIGPGSQRADLFGWTAGGGAEFAVTPRILLRGEYRYYDFGPESLDMPVPYTTRDYDVILQTVSFGAAFKF